MEEIWMDIHDYEGLYQVSNLGRIKSLKRKVYAGNGKMRWQYEKILSNNKTNGNGYKIVSLSKKSKNKNKYVHRLVMETFAPNKINFKSMPIENRDEFDLEKLEVNHIDENKSNNSVDNLEWCTPLYNNLYNNKNIRAKKTRIRKHIGCKKILQMNDNDEIIKEYLSIKQASEEMKVSNQAISDCLRGIQKHSAGYKWKYADDVAIKQ